MIGTQPAPAPTQSPDHPARVRHRWSSGTPYGGARTWLPYGPALSSEDRADYARADDNAHGRGDGNGGNGNRSDTPGPSQDQRQRAGSAHAGPADDTGPLGSARNGLGDVATTLRAIGRLLPSREDSRDLDLDALDDCIAALKRVEGAAAAVKAKLVSCAAGAKAHDAAGMTGTDAYLRDRMGLSAREAKKQAELARGLDGMDGAADALADGRLGPEQAAALGRAARKGQLGTPDQVEQQLLDDATSSSPEQLQEKIRRAEQNANDDALRRGENRAHAQRRASCTRRPDGMWQLHALLDPVNGEQVATAMRAYTTPDPTGTPISERRSPQQRAADGLTDMAAAALAAGGPVAGGVRPHVSIILRPEDDQSGGEHTEGCADPADDGHDNAGGDRHDSDRPDDDRHDSDRHEGGPGPSASRRPRQPATTGRGATISPEATARLLCDARVTRIVMNAASQVLDVGRATRTWSTAQRTAITARDHHCRGPGCDRPPDWCHIHHIRWWSKGGRTDLDNGILLCTRHHRMVHEGNWTIRLNPATAEATFTAPAGTSTITRPG